MLKGSGTLEFVLYYRGRLRANGKPRDKHEIRKAFHSQLAQLWAHKPLNELASTLLRNPEDSTPGGLSILERVGAFTFAPLICSKLHLFASIAITMLRPEPPGKILTQAGDIDNRLKTLFDALKMPSLAELPPGAAPETNEEPFFCLLQDDNLITKLAVETDRLLDSSAESSEVVLLLHIWTSKLVTIWKNIDL
jgi:hypothetical protein